MSTASTARTSVPRAYNEPSRDYEPGSEDAKQLASALQKMKASMKESPLEVPCVVGGAEIRTGDMVKQYMPQDHAQTVCTFHQANEDVMKQAVAAAADAKRAWHALPWEDRAAVFLRAADLLTTKYRYEMLAATMLGQGKTVWQAEIEAVAEMADFWRFGVQYAEEIYEMQPPKNAHGSWNWMDHRPLEGFVVAVTPFNFTSIGANLPSSPAIMGNTVLWKPASTAIRSNFLVYKILEEAGLPAGVINFVPGRGSVVGESLFNHPDCAGVHFTGSTATFNRISYQLATNTQDMMYKNFPRIVGETGGKCFHFVDKSYEHIDHLVAGTIRGAFEYQGQKCSACSRMFVPDNLWPRIRAGLVAMQKEIKMGNADDFSSFMSAVIDSDAFDKIKGYIDWATNDKDCEILAGGKYDDSKGYFVEPTLIVCKSLDAKVLKEEIFGPVLSIYVYPANNADEILTAIDQGSSYALTGSIYSSDRLALRHAVERLRYTAGNLYINDKCTAAVVGQQPFGGARLSGTNDKAGSKFNLLRWTSPRTIKETMTYTTEFKYPHMK